MNNQTKKKRHILVTGCPRSGTTFLGKVLSFPTEVGYIREPFNRDFGLDDLEYEFPYMHRGMQKEQVYRDMVEALLSRKANFKSLPPSGANNLKQSVGRMLFGSGSNYSYIKSTTNPLVQRYLLKDPMASLGSEYLHREYDFDVVVIMRKPLPTIASMRRLGLVHSLEELANQEKLRELYLPEEVLGHLGQELTLLERQALLWTAINAVLQSFVERNSRFIVVQHHALATRPVKELSKLYKKLDLAFTPAIKSKVEEYTSSKNVSAITSDKMYILKRNSRAIADVKQGVFTPDEEQRIYELTDRVASKIFGSV